MFLEYTTGNLMLRTPDVRASLMGHFAQTQTFSSLPILRLHEQVIVTSVINILPIMSILCTTKSI